MEILATLFIGWLLLGALRRLPRATPTITIQVVEWREGDGRGPRESPIIPRPEPEVERANRRAKSRA